MAYPASASLRTVRVLVTGASGFVGRWVVAALQKRGAEVAVVAREPDRLPVQSAAAARVFRADCARPGALASPLERWRPAVVFNLAGYGVAKNERDPALMRRLNVELLAEVVEGLARLPAPSWPGLRLVHAGSALEYGELDVPLDESAAAHPTTSYGQSKFAGTEVVQRAVREQNLPALVARLFTVFGPGERDGRLFPTLLAARSHQEAVPLSSGEQQRDFGLVWDVAEALVDLALAPKAAVLACEPPFEHAVLNVASGRLSSVRTFVVEAAQALGIAPSRLAFGAKAQLPEEMPHLPVPVARLQRALGRTLPGDLAVLMARVRVALDRGVHG
ncbi:MAG: NAD-dependent epimerase/dehydratase family protein [Planctomycetota bacterium]